MFKVGDIVEMTAEAAATGMLDFVEGNSYDVISTTGIDPQSILLENESREGGWYHSGHFKLKEDTIVEKKECLFKEGQVVWDLIYGKGAVSSVDFLNFPSYPVCVKFDQLVTYKPVLGSYTAEGISSEFGIRSLYFSEPKIEAATEPLFEPTLEEGDKVVCIDKDIEFSSGPIVVLTVIEEDEKFVKTSEYGLMGKHRWDFYLLGEKINFK